MRLVSYFVAGLVLLASAGSASAWHIGLYGGCGPRCYAPYVPIAPAMGYPIAPAVTLGYSAPLGYAASLGYVGYAAPTFGYSYMPTAAMATGAAPASSGQSSPTFAAQGDLGDAVARLRSQVAGLSSDVQQIVRMLGTHNDSISDLQQRVNALERKPASK